MRCLVRGASATALLITLLIQGGAHAQTGPSSLKSDMEKAALQYFLDNANPKTGLVRDNAANFAATPDSNTLASIASTGFGLAVVANASVQGLVTKEFAEAYALKVLKFCRDHVGRYHGWFYHFIDWNSGANMVGTEYSTIDTALFMGGALYAAQLFPNSEVYRLAHQLYLDLDFLDFMTNGGTQPEKRTLSMAYTEGQGYTPAQWNMYGEEMLLLVLGLGHPLHPLPEEAWLAFNRAPLNPPAYPALMGVEQALFVHQYSYLFIDFRRFHDKYASYFENSILMSHYQRDLMRTSNSETLKAGFWGFSAGEAPHDLYQVYTPLRNAGTVCIGCAIGSVMFLPQEIMADATAWTASTYKEQIWGRYGFTDSIDLDQKWFSPQVLGITVGPEFLSLANMNDATSLWKTFMQIPEIQEGLRVASSAGLTAQNTQQ